MALSFSRPMAVVIAIVFLMATYFIDKTRIYFQVDRVHTRIHSGVAMQDFRLQSFSFFFSFFFPPSGSPIWCNVR